MASYAEIWGLFNDGTLHQRTAVACLIAADAIRQESGSTNNHANRLIWAKKVYQDPVAAGAQMLKALLAIYNASTLAQIQSATDAQIQSAVNSSVDIFADGS